MERVLVSSGLGSSVGIATRYGLDGPGSNLGGGARFAEHVQTGPGAHPASSTMGTGSFSGGKERLGRDADPSPLPVLWSRKSRAISLLTLWAVRPVQSLSVYTRVHFNFLLVSTDRHNNLRCPWFYSVLPGKFKDNILY